MNKKTRMLKNFIADRNKKSYFLMLKEVLKLYMKEGVMPTYYLTRLVYKKDSPRYDSFVNFNSMAKLWDVSSQLHTKETIEILEDKEKFDIFCIQNNIPTAKSLGYIKDSILKYESLNKIIKTKKDFKLEVEKIIKDNQIESIFLKPIDGMQGKGCYRISLEDFNDDKIISKLVEEIRTADYILQETITQHDRLNNINPYSINTIRVDTYIKDDGSVEILSALMRFGRKGSVVDNSSSGGFFIPLNLDTGELGDHGMQFLELGNKYIYEHADTKVKLKNYEIPYVEEAKLLIKEAAFLLGDRLVGWDIAITPNGPIVIEGNSNYHIGMQEMAYGGYKNHPTFKKILEDYT